MNCENWKTVRLGDVCEKKRSPQTLALRKQEKEYCGSQI